MLYNISYMVIRIQHSKQTVTNAFHTWRRNNHNIEATLRDLKKQGYNNISRPTIYAWMRKYNWEERATKADVEEQKIFDMQVSFEEKMLSDLLRQKETYDKYFETINGIDNQAQFAYNKIVELIIELKAKLLTFRIDLFIEFLREFIGYLRHQGDKAGIEVIEKHFDGFIDYAKKKYKKT